MIDDLTKDLLHELFDYNDGQLIWKVDRGTYKIKGRIINTKSSHGYIIVGINNRRYYVHRLIYMYFNGSTNGKQIDHINRIRDDNRIENLRLVTHQENHFNRTGVHGYYWHKDNKKWSSQIVVGDKSIFLGLYEIENDARNAYLTAKKEYHIINN